MTRLVLFPGLGADERMFQAVGATGFSVELATLPDPEAGMTLAELCGRDYSHLVDSPRRLGRRVFLWQYGGDRDRTSDTGSGGGSAGRRNRFLGGSGWGQTLGRTAAMAPCPMDSLRVRYEPVYERVL